MSARSRRPGSGKPPAPDLEALAGALAALPRAAPPPRAPRPDSKRLAVERLREPLRQAQARGYSIVALAAILTRAGLAIRASTLGQYLGPGRAGRARPADESGG